MELGILARRCPVKDDLVWWQLVKAEMMTRQDAKETRAPQLLLAYCFPSTMSAVVASAASSIARTSTSAPSPSRLRQLKALQCALFQISYNPTNARTGAKYLRARLKGPSMINYYPKVLNIQELRKSATGARLMIDEEEEERIQDVEDKKARGKGAPTKAKSKGEWTGSSIVMGGTHKSRLQVTVGVQVANGDLNRHTYYIHLHNWHYFPFLF